MDIQSRLNHQNIVRLYNCFQNDEYLILKLEYCKMSLRDYTHEHRKKVMVFSVLNISNLIIITENARWYLRFGWWFVLCSWFLTWTEHSSSWYQTWQHFDEKQSWLVLGAVWFWTCSWSKLWAYWTWHGRYRKVLTTWSYTKKVTTFNSSWYLVVWNYDVENTEEQVSISRKWIYQVRLTACRYKPNLDLLFPTQPKQATVSERHSSNKR